MQYRKFGRIGNISALGFGCMRLPEIEGADGSFSIDEEKAIPLLRRAYDLGVNYFDTAVGYCHQNSQYTVGRAVKPFRDKIMLSTKIPLSDCDNQGYFRKMLEQSLSRLDTEYIDVYHFHGINKALFDDKILKFDLLKEARRAIDEGLIRHISFSFHDSPEAMGYIIERGEIFSSVLCQYNLLDRANEEAIANAAEKGLGVVIMGPVGGGRLGGASALGEKVGVRSGAATPELALRFVLGNRNVSCALSGMRDLEMLEKNAAVAGDETSLTETEFADVNRMLSEIEKFRELYCTGCEYCLPCPKEIRIPEIFRAYNLANVYGLSEAAKQQYAHIASRHQTGTASGACVSCRACVKKCPQNLDIPALLKKAEAALGV
ncbi:MAG: aldo/keto reductase [Clostridiales bacterium]|nr:aldo/keto reductase [Clostridiales bacterium]